MVFTTNHLPEEHSICGGKQVENSVSQSDTSAETAMSRSRHILGIPQCFTTLIGGRGRQVINEYACSVRAPGSLSGEYNTGFSNSGYNGYYWSSTANSTTNAYNLNFNYSNVNPGNNNNNKYNGFAVRCVL